MFKIDRLLSERILTLQKRYFLIHYSLFLYFLFPSQAEENDLYTAVNSENAISKRGGIWAQYLTQ